MTTLLAQTPTPNAGGQIALAAVLGVVGVYLLLPRPRGRFVAAGVAALVAAAAVFGAWTYSAFGKPVSDVLGTALFWLFSAGALGFGTVLVVQKNPARGAIAFAFVVLSTCGLFLLLAAPFLMAATIIIYAGAIVVTFLFVLMLSHADGPSDENDRSREPLYGSFAGFAFVGLVLFALYATSQAGTPAEPGRAKPDSRLPVPVLTAAERHTLAAAAAKLAAAEKELDGDLSTNGAREKFSREYCDPIRNELAEVVGETGAAARDGTIRERLEKSAARGNVAAVLYREDAQTRAALDGARRVREANFGRALDNALMGDKPDAAAVKAQIRALRDAVVLLHGMGELPADNVRNLGLVLYSEHLLSVELAGTLLLVAVVGAIAVAHRKGVAK
jgi:NADH:ubiquinone oxidoreductase subunit 6 (subunit J)